jgi:hypothetical protein
LPDQIGLAITIEIAGAEHLERRVDGTIRNEAAAYVAVPVEELDFGQAVCPAINQVRSPVAVEVAGRDNSPARVEWTVLDDPATDCRRSIQQLDLGRMRRLVLPCDVGFAVAIEVADSAIDQG